MANEDEGFLNGEAGEGTDHISANDLSRSFLKIAQSTTPEVAEGKIEGIKAGDFFSPLAQETFGKCIDVVVLKYEHVYDVWQKNRGGLVSIVPFDAVASGAYKTYPTSDRKLIDEAGNDVIESYNFYILLVGHEALGPLILSFQSTGLRHARNWLTKISALRTPNGKAQAAIFQGVWRIETVLNKNDKGAWFQIGDKSTTTVDLVNNICGKFTKADGTVIDGQWDVPFVKDTVMPVYQMCKDMSSTQALAAPEAQRALPSSGHMDPSI